MVRLFRWAIEFWIIRFLLRWFFRLAVLMVLVLGVLMVSGKYEGLKHWLFASADKAVGTQGAVESTAAHAEALTRPAVDGIRSGLRQDRDAIRNAAAAVRATGQRTEPTDQMNIAQDPDQLNNQLESLRGRDAKSPDDAAGGH